ncbi:Nif3-like dinuclear metal center hexameric protein [Paenactinomyces guangxiensis]|uniref:GTP cyclohydrolase 1 type 2 homolog n=1 Tax=Paenactinomyces guangxiensis TaxID=1490290 RepID=A0A7W1WP51_9BACL|nr:Nif3-like dinuclear metal center hexameric protein [Paenactinomyces guangxiensis]MBA4493477.1 Nif3-like dinuclear metal center hexameric protein [Paenactinomyces guangxiensis]MBH8590568.1 Nif3-like dinuclear metal center hexameric protein [Paenactinomyces guangxiensis]
MAITVQNILDKLMEPVGKIPNTVDTLKSGDPNMEVKGITTSFMPTHYVIHQSIKMGANLLITHEGLFYSHMDNTETLKSDPVYNEKRRLIDESGIAIYRFHDYWHRYQPDGIMVGLIQALGWQPYVDENQPAATILTVPVMTVREIAEYVKNRLGIKFVRVTGDLSTPCTRIGLLAGYRGGGDLSIPLFEKENLDLIISGEGPEWETPEYVRDAVYQGKQKAFIVLGHAESEEPGMKYLSEWMKTIFPSIPIHFVPEKQTFQVI